MRTFVLLLVFLWGCASKNANPGSPPLAPETAPPLAPETATLDAVQMRACESCRHNLELCRQRIGARAGVEGSQSGPVAADCMGEFVTCLNLQQLDSARCQGLN